MFDYFKYLQNTRDRGAFLAGCQAMIDIYDTSSPSEIVSLLLNPSEQSIIAALSAQEQRAKQLQRREAALLILTSDVNKSNLRGMVFDCAHLNASGYATDEYGNPIEDINFQLLPGATRCPWPYTLARHKYTGHTITRVDYEALTPDQQQYYDVFRFLNLYRNGKHLAQISSDNEACMTELIAHDMRNGDPIMLRYLCECGAGHGPLPRGRFYAYREVIAKTANELGVIGKVLTEHISAGYINSPGQFYLAWLQNIPTALTARQLISMPGRLLDTLRNLIDNDGGLTHLINDDDIRYYRSVNGHSLMGTQPIAKNKEPENADASDSHCDISMQRIYIRETLKPQARAAAIQILANVSDDSLIDAKPDTINAIIDLIYTVDPAHCDESSNKSTLDDYNIRRLQQNNCARRNECDPSTQSNSRDDGDDETAYTSIDDDGKTQPT